MNHAPAIPGLSFEVVRPPEAEEPLRTDVLAVIGRAARGPIGRPVRITGWRAFSRIFGGLAATASTPHAVQGAFANGAEVIWMTRVASGQITTATLEWPAQPALLPHESYRFDARSPGGWGNALSIDIAWRSEGLRGRPELEVIVRLPGEPAERHAGLGPADWFEVVNRDSARVSVTPGPSRRGGFSARRGHRWRGLRLGGGKSEAPDLDAYVHAFEAQRHLAEPALVVAPDMYPDLGPTETGATATLLLAASAAQTGDRLVVLDVPETLTDPIDAITWIEALRQRLDPFEQRALAVYPSRLLVIDRRPAAIDPVRTLTPVGHVAGVIARLDRERGPHSTPADVTLVDAVDVHAPLAAAEEEELHLAQLNPIAVVRGRGALIRGGRTLDRSHDGRFIAHRRLIHRLVRAMRRVLAPLVFETNGPDLRLSIVRAVTTLLLETWRSGGLRGERPEDGFRVRCDDATTPPAEVDAGRLICEVDIAPAVPMEFITIRVAVGRDGTLEIDT